MGLGSMNRDLIDLDATFPLRISYWPGQVRKLVVVFSGVGRFPDEYPSIEFFRSATEDEQNHVLFVSDFSRSWLNAPDMDRNIIGFIEKTAADNRIDDIALVGNSMGGTMALHLADQVPAKMVMSFVPQYSVAPQIVPEEKRWKRYRRNISEFRYPQVDLTKREDQTIYIIHGGTGGELTHALRFPLARGIRHFVIPRYGHNLAKKLNNRGILHPLLGAALKDRRVRVRRLIEREGGLFLRDFKRSLDENELPMANRA